MNKIESYWLHSTPETNYGFMPGEIKTDVVVIGAGITGLTTAYLLKRSGLKVTVIESGKIISDVTGNTTAKVTSAHGVIYKELIDTFGKDKAYLYAEAQESAIRKIAELTKKLKIECDLKQELAYTFTEKEEGVSKIQEEVDAALSLKLPVSYTESTSLPFPIRAAIKYKNQMQFHPRKYLLGIAKEIDDDDSHIFENTRALKIEEGTPCKVFTDKGIIYAKKVVIATHFPFFDRGLYFTRLSPHKSYVNAVTIKGKVFDGMYYSLDEDGYSFRTQPSDEGELILVGGEGHKAGQGGDIVKRFEKLEKYTKRIFDVRKVEYCWTTQDNKTIDKVPYIGKDIPNSKHIFVATGFGGWGMTNGTVAGMLLTDLINNKKNDWEGVFEPSRFKIISTKKFMSEGLNVGKEVIQGIVSGEKKDEVKKLKNGEGAIIKRGPEKLAVYKSGKGRVCALSAVCTHLGCIVNFNNAEKSWDCPCHGSRFSLQGKVLHGPATKDLEEKEL